MAEQLFCVIGGVCLIIAGVALSRLRPPDWSSASMTTLEQQRINTYSRFQRGIRWINNRLISVIGGLIVCTAAIPHGRNWIIAWSAIFFFLLMCIFLAMLDALSSIFSYKRTLPSTLRSTLGEDSKQS